MKKAERCETRVPVGVLASRFAGNRQESCKNDRKGWKGA